MADKYIIEAATYNGDGTTSSEAVGSTVTITIASPGVVTWTGHTLVANDPVYFKTTGALPTGLTAGTKYYVRNPATNTFEVSATSGGASINTSGSQSGTHTASGVGAWNHVDIITGVAVGNGSIAAGDKINIRSKTGNGANANITVTLSGTTNLGSSAASSTSPVTWVLDNGTIWSTIDGTLTFAGSAAAHQILPRSFNVFVANTPHNWIFKNTSSSANYLVTVGASFVEFSMHGMFLDCSAGAVGYTPLEIAQNQCTVYLENCKIKGSPGASTANVIGATQSGTALTLVNPTIELTHTCTKVFGYIGSGSTVRVIGGSMSGAGCTSTTVLQSMAANSNYGQLDFIGFQYPQEVTVTSAFNDAWPVGFRVVGADNGAGSVNVDRWGIASSRSDGYFPYCNAALPNSTATGWSWYVYSDNAHLAHPWSVPAGKYFTDTAATKTIKANLLVATGYGSAVDTSTLWLVVSYIDHTTGATKYVSSRSFIPGTALTTSSTTWSATTYGAVSFDKREISVTTPTSVKKDTVMWATLFGTNKSGGSASKYFFVCPDVVVS